MTNTVLTPFKKAKDATISALNRVIFAGTGGAGKTAQLTTLAQPGQRAFAYLFDPNGLATLQGVDTIDYLEFLPQSEDVDLVARGGKSKPSDRKAAKRSDKYDPSLYNRWVQDLNDRFDAGFFGDYDWLFIDGMTMLVDAAMSRQLHVQGNHIPEIQDYQLIGIRVGQIWQGLYRLNINLACTCHVELRRDERSGKTEEQLLLPARSRQRLPLVHNSVLYCYCDDGRYWVRAQNDKAHPYCRTYIRGLDPVIDVTIPLDGWSHPHDYGWGRLLHDYSSGELKLGKK